MKKTVMLISVVAITALNLIGVANGKGNASELIEKAVDVKCYVELVGGGETISLWFVKPSLLKELTHTIIGQEISLVSTSEQMANKKKGTIYKAKECILEEDEFSHSKARAMDKELPR